MKLQFYSNNCNIYIFWIMIVAVTDNVIEKTNLFIGRLCINID